MPPGRSQQIATCLNLMGDWRDSVRSQRSEKTDAVRVCRKTSGWTLCFDERGRNTWIATKCYCLLTQARQWATALSTDPVRPLLAGQRRSQSYPEWSSALIGLSGTQKAVRTQCATPAAPGRSELIQQFATTANPVER